VRGNLFRLWVSGCKKSEKRENYSSEGGGAEKRGGRKWGEGLKRLTLRGKDLEAETEKGGKMEKDMGKTKKGEKKS